MNHYHLENAIGNTPLVELRRLNPNPLVTILAKLEFFNPGSSIKDRMVKHIIGDAEKRGLLKPGGTIIEATSGNTGAAIAMFAASRGYKAIFTVLDKVSKEKIDALKAYGARVVVCKTAVSRGSSEHYENVAKHLAQTTPNSFYLDQHDNPKNAEAHYQTTGREIWKQTEGRIDYFVAAAGTGGTVSGAGKFLKEKNPRLKVIVPDPVGSVYYDFFKTGKVPASNGCTYQLEGIGGDYIPGTMDFSVIDDVYQCTDKDAFITARRLAKEEGILAGGSSGANVWAALKLAESLTANAVIVTILSDSGVRYLSKLYNDEWMRKQGLKGLSGFNTLHI